MQMTNLKHQYYQSSSLSSYAAFRVNCTVAEKGQRAGLCTSRKNVGNRPADAGDLL